MTRVSLGKTATASLTNGRIFGLNNPLFIKTNGDPYGSPFVFIRVQITEYRLQSTDNRVQITEYR